MTNGQPSDPHERLTTARAALRALLAQVETASGLVAPQIRASVVQLQAVIAAEKAALRGAGSAVADAPEDTVGLPSADMTAVNNASNQGAQGTFYGSVAITVVNREEPGAPAPDVYAQYRAYLLRLLPPLDAHAQPYLGLQTFQFEHADRFFGRDRLVAELAERLGRAPFLAVLGASGSGKSSVVRAGLLPLLKAGGLPGSERWQYVILRPGARPLNALAAALNEVRGGSTADGLALLGQLGEPDALLAVADMLRARLVLVVDQAEELWTLQPTDPEQRTSWQEQQQRPFLRLLLRALGTPDRPLLVILALRADFLHRAIDDPILARTIADHDLFVSPMTNEELRAAIELPAWQAKGAFEPGLVEELIAQTQGGEGALPLLEYTLQELWSQRQEGGLMTWACYRALGGVEGALAKRADTILQQHYTLEQQGEVRQVLLRLIQPGEGAADTRRRVALADLAAAGQPAEALQILLQPLIDARLLTSGQDQQATVEVAHEALIRSWPTLRGWIEEARADLRLQIQLEEAAKEWETNNKDTSLLWDGLRLSTGEAWVQRTQPHLNARDAAFLEASRAEVRHQAEVEAQAERDRLRLAEEQRNAGRLRRFLLLTGLLLTVAIFATVVAIIGLWQAEKAQSEAAYANRRSQALILAGSALDALPSGDKRAIVLTLAAQMIAPKDEDDALVARARLTAIEPGQVRQILRGHTQAVLAASWNPTGDLVLTGSQDHTARLWNASTGQTLFTLQGHTDAVVTVAWSPDGTKALTGSRDGTARSWQVSNGASLRVFLSHTAHVNTVSWNPDGKTILTSSDDTTARIWNAESAALMQTLQGHTAPIVTAVWSPDGTRVLTGSRDGTARIWDAASGKLLSILNGHQADVVTVAWRSDGQYIAIGSTDSTVYLWDNQGHEQQTIHEAHSEITLLAWRDDGSLVINDTNGECFSWNPKDKGVSSVGVYNIMESKDAVNWISGNKKGMIHASLISNDHIDDFFNPIFYSMGVSPDRRTMISLENDSNSVVLRDLSGKIIKSFGDSIAVSLASQSWSPDGNRFIFYDLKNQQAKIWDVKNNKQIYSFKGNTKGQFPSWSPDGKKILTLLDEGIVQIWDSSSGQLLYQFQHPILDNKQRVLAMWSPDGKQISTMGSLFSIIWDSSNGKKLHTFENASNDGTSIVFRWNPTGNILCTYNSSNDMVVHIWNTHTWEHIRDIKGHTGAITSISWSPNGKQLATGGVDNTVRLWDVDSGEMIHMFQGYSSGLPRIKWSPSGNEILVSTQIWDTKTFSPIFKINPEGFSSEQELWSPSGKYMVINHSLGQTIWDAPNHQNMYFFRKNAIILTEWSPDEKYILFTDNHQRVHVFLFDRHLLVAELTRRVCILYNYDDDTIRSAVPGGWEWAGCDKALAMVGNDLRQYDQIYGRTDSVP